MKREMIGNKRLTPRDIATIAADLETNRIRLRSFTDTLIAQNENILKQLLEENEDLWEMPIAFFLKLGGTTEAANKWICENEKIIAPLNLNDIQLSDTLEYLKLRSKQTDQSFKSNMEKTSIAIKPSANYTQKNFRSSQKTKNNMNINLPIVTSDFTKELGAILEGNSSDEETDNKETNGRQLKMQNDIGPMMDACARSLRLKKKIDCQ